MTRAPSIALAITAALAAAAATAHADPLRLRGDALASAQAPAGLLVLEADDRARPWIDAEAVVWTGVGPDQDASGGGDPDADALIMRVELRDLKRRAALRVGRHLVVAGALRPLHLDGLSGRAALPARFEAQAFAGLPVVPRLGERSWDWAIGARAARPVGDARFGLAWMQRRDRGALHTHELALDATYTLRRTDLGASGAYDLAGGGLAEARLAATHRLRAVRLEAFAVHRSASHLLPATSLFSVLGDVPSRLAGADVRWRAAPRLDVGGSAGVRFVDDEAHEDLVARATLRLDDRGDGAIGLELRRQGAPAPDGDVDERGGWTGVRGFGRLPLTKQWTASTELELAVPDHDAGRGAVWPWGLVAIGYRPEVWEIAGAIEASASPEYRHRVDALVRVSRRWEVPH